MSHSFEINRNSLQGGPLYNSMKRYVLTLDQQIANGFPQPRSDSSDDRALINPQNISQLRSLPGISLKSNERSCDRCGTIYQVDSKGLASKQDDACFYHWGRSYQRRGFKTPYTCCNRDSSSKGCTENKWHISENINSLRGFVRTAPVKSIPLDGNYGVYALDCEMCYTTEGCEALSVTVVSSECKTVYETRVRSVNPVLDYNTRFTGITERDMQNVTTTLKDVQAVLLDLFSDQTILIGHSLDGDLRALRLIHDTVIDTSIVFPHSQGPPLKRALKTLCSEYLHKDIQRKVGGHDCAEDATACMELVMWKVKQNLKTFR